MANPKIQPSVEIDWENFSPDNDDYLSIKHNAMEFARHNLNAKNRQEETVAWFRSNQSADADAVAALPEWKFATVGMYHYILNRKGVLSDETMSWLKDKTASLISEGRSAFEENARLEEAKKAVVKIDPQVRDQRLGNGLAFDLEDLILAGWDGDAGPFNEIVLNENVTPKMLMVAGAKFQEFVDETLSFREEEIEEGFRSRTEYEKSRDAYVEMNRLLDVFITSSRNRRKGSAKRNGKLTRAEKATVKATEKVNFRKADNDLGLVSIDPSLIVGATALLVFNTKDRKLGLYHAEKGKTLAVKGTTVQDFDPATSVQKKLRNPKEQIQSFHKVQLRRAELVFSDYIRAKENALTGRLNEHVLLVAVWK